MKPKKDPYRRPFEKLRNEIEVQDTLFRRDFDAEKRQRVLSWLFGGRDKYFDEESEIIRQFITNKIDVDAALLGITELMKKYYAGKV
jgi:hypothetical protein